MDSDSVGLPGPKQIGLPLGLGLSGPKQIGLFLGLGLPRSKANRTLPWTRALESKANRAPAARGVVVTGPNPLHHHAHQSEVHMQMYIEGMCATKAKNGFSKDREVGRCIGAGGAFDSPSGCPQ